MLLFIFFHEVLKKQRSSVRGRSFTKNEHDGSQRPDSCHVYPQLKPAEQGWWHSTQGFKCQHPLSHGPTPVGRPPAPRPLLSHPGPHCKQFWLRKALRGERAGGGGDSPRPCHSLHGQVPPESQLSPGVFQAAVTGITEATCALGRQGALFKTSQGTAACSLMCSPRNYLVNRNLCIHIFFPPGLSFD